jgi:hypothetical protein
MCVATDSDGREYVKGMGAPSNAIDTIRVAVVLFSATDPAGSFWRDNNTLLSEKRNRGIVRGRSKRIAQQTLLVYKKSIPQMRQRG